MASFYTGSWFIVWLLIFRLWLALLQKSGKFSYLSFFPSIFSPIINAEPWWQSNEPEAWQSSRFFEFILLVFGEKKHALCFFLYALYVSIKIEEMEINKYIAFFLRLGSVHAHNLAWVAMCEISSKYCVPL